MSSILNSASENCWDISAELILLEIILDISETLVHLCTTSHIKNMCRTVLLVAFLKDTDGWSLVQELRMTQWKSDNDTRFGH